MDIFAQVACEFKRLPHAGTWMEAEKLFETAASRKPEHWLIPAQACEAVGGSQEQALPAIVAIGCAHIGILLVDDMLDEDPRGDYHHLGMPASANLAGFFQALAFHAVSASTPNLVARVVAIKSFCDMYLSTAFGQFLDVQSPVNESAYWYIAKTKSSPFFATALQLGALTAGAPLEIAEQFKALGGLYGEMIQIHDDMHDAMEVPANPDWIQGRSPLPILFASLVQHPDRARFMDLKKQANSPDALQEAQEILIRCGAISYCADQLIQRYKMAIKMLSAIPLSNDEPVSTLLNKIIAPVNQLLKTWEE